MKAHVVRKEPLTHAAAIKLLRQAVLLLDKNPHRAATIAGDVALNTREPGVWRVARAIESLAIDLAFWGPNRSRPKATPQQPAASASHTHRQIRFPRIRFRKAKP